LVLSLGVFGIFVSQGVLVVSLFILLLLHFAISFGPEYEYLYFYLGTFVVACSLIIVFRFFLCIFDELWGLSYQF